MTKPYPDPFLKHRAALFPWRPRRGAVALGSVLASDPQGFCDFLLENGLGPLWNDFLRNRREASAPEIPERLVRRVRTAHHGSAAMYLLQAQTLRTVSAALEEAGIVHAVFKGAALRECLYADPTLRPMDDLDILVAPEQRDAALRALLGRGLRLVVDPKTISHEVALFDGQVHVDLHWRLFRPGRSRFELAPTLLGHRTEQKGIWVLDDTASLLVMLVHPAFAKHVCGPAAKLVRLLDLDRLLQTADPDWDHVLDLLSAAGLRTAAWATLYWLRTLLESDAQDAILRQLRPSLIHRGYLKYWIGRNLPTRLASIPLAVQGAFTLALHDGLTDALRATTALAATVLSRGRDLRLLPQGSPGP